MAINKNNTVAVAPIKPSFLIMLVANNTITPSNNQAPNRTGLSLNPIPTIVKRINIIRYTKTSP